MIFGEPTNNEMIVGTKGLLECELNFKGIKVHSSEPEKGKSANMNAAKFLVELEEFYNAKVKSYKEEKYKVPYTTMNAGIINGGSAKNSISANCYATIDFRIANKKHINVLKEKMNELTNKYDCKISIIEEIELFIDKIDFIKESKTANFITEASAVKGSKRIILGTGPVTAHEVNEYITEESYALLVNQYKNLIQKICK